MAGSYSADLRGRVLAAVEAGATPGAAARRFAVGRSTAHRWATAARVEGRRVAKRLGGRPKPRVSGEGGGARRGPEAADQRRGGGGAAGVVGGGEPPDLGRVPRPARRAHGGAGAPVDGGPGAAAGRLGAEGAAPGRRGGGAGGG